MATQGGAMESCTRAAAAASMASLVIVDVVGEMRRVICRAVSKVDWLGGCRPRVWMLWVYAVIRAAEVSVSSARDRGFWVRARPTAILTSWTVGFSRVNVVTTDSADPDAGRIVDFIAGVHAIRMQGG